MVRERIQKLMEWYDRRISPLAFLAGFVFDTLTLTRIDLLRDNLIFLAHLTISGLGIALVNAYEAGKIKGSAIDKIAWLFPLMIQFSFGALFSGFFVLYFRSGSLIASWIFFLFLATLLIGNEFFRHHYQKFIFHISIYFVALSSYAILIIPVITHRMGAGIFLMSGVASLTAIAIVIYLIHFIAPNKFRESRRALIATIATIYGAFNLLYFTNIIPPIPLSLKHLGIYHDVERTSLGNYRLQYEEPPWYAFFRETASQVHLKKGAPVYAFSAVFAPTNINTTIYHHWMYFDEKTEGWMEKDILAIPITGGRNDGYRGYSLKHTLQPGTWRIDVKTGRGQLIGRRNFEIIETDTPPELESHER